MGQALFNKGKINFGNTPKAMHNAAKKPMAIILFNRSQGVCRSAPLND